MARKYTLKRRAEKQEKTRQRIVEAIVDLHKEVGPAQTTISAIAERAGVQRLTVYRHFPDERALIQASSSHWLTQHPPPDASAWRRIANPRERVAHGLRDLYSYYACTEQMNANILRDAPRMPVLHEFSQPFYEAIHYYHDILSETWDILDETQALFSAAILHALSFQTWRSLIREQGLAPEEAVDLMVCLIESAAGSHQGEKKKETVA